MEEEKAEKEFKLADLYLDIGAKDAAEAGTWCLSEIRRCFAPPC